MSNDKVRPFMVPALSVRGQVVQLDKALNTILERHDMPEPVNRLLGEGLAFTAMLAASYKSAERLTLQSQGEGAVSLMVVDFQTPDALRAMVRFDEEKLATPEKNTPVTSGALLGNGHLAITIETGKEAESYQGYVALNEAGLEAAANEYFNQSVQIPTRIKLAVSEVITANNGTQSSCWRAGGMMVQHLPENTGEQNQREDEDVAQTTLQQQWQEAIALFETLEAHELTDPNITSDDIIYRLFNEHETLVFEPQGFVDKCSCSREKIARVLEKTPPAELLEMAVDGKIESQCQFCSQRYSFDIEKDFVPD